jgi:hypothetical protein
MLLSFKGVEPLPYPPRPCFSLTGRTKREQLDRMKTVYDYRATLEVICGNCDHSRVFNHRFLKSQFGSGQILTKLKFVCKCGARRYRLRIVADKVHLTLPVTYHVVIAFDRDAEGDLKPGEAREVLSPIIAERRARALAVGHAGALAFSRTGDPATGEFCCAPAIHPFGARVWG